MNGSLLPAGYAYTSMPGERRMFGGDERWDDKGEEAAAPCTGLRDALTHG